MSLQSRLLRGDPELEAAAVADAAHITLGARGPAVGRIQQALILLDHAAIVPDRQYGPATAAAVLAYKRKRGIVNRSRQTQADAIVGTMTMAALDRELLALEQGLARPVQVRAVLPAARPATPADLAPAGRLQLGFAFDVDPKFFPGGNLAKLRLVPGREATLEILHGTGGTARLLPNTKPSSGPLAELRDPAAQGLQDGRQIAITQDPHRVLLRAFAPGNAFVDARTPTSANTLGIQIRAEALGPVPGTPPTKPVPGRRFVSAGDSEPCESSVRIGRPIGPIGTGRKINLWGERETPGFEDYAADLEHSMTGRRTFRPWTADGDRPPGIADRTASDICIRGAPIHDVTITEIRRIAAPGCRLTCFVEARFVARLKQEFPFQPLEEFADSGGLAAVVIPFP